MDLHFTFSECGTARQLLVPLSTSAHAHRHYTFLRIPERLQQLLYLLVPQAWLFHLCVYSVAYVRPLPWCVATQGASPTTIWDFGLRRRQKQSLNDMLASVSVIALIGTFQMAHSSPHHWKLSDRAVLWSSEWSQLLWSNIKRRRAHLIWFWDSWLILLLSFSNFKFISEQIFTAYWDLCA